MNRPLLTKFTIKIREQDLQGRQEEFMEWLKFKQEDYFCKAVFKEYGPHVVIEVTATNGHNLFGLVEEFQKFTDI